MWLQRLSRFSEGNEYYIQFGKFNVYTGTTQMPNCTAYAKLRMSEECELKEPQSTFVGRSATGFSEAKNWFNDTALPKGYELKEGAIAVFDGASGHVCVVEKKISDTKAIISQSQWTKDKSIRDYRYWEIKEVDLIVGKATISGVGALIGFIYPNINDIRVERDAQKEQLAIVEDMVNARNRAEGEYTCMGLYVPQGTYNVLSKKVVNDYTWYKLDTNVWVREGSWTKYYPKETTKDYKAMYEALLKDMKAIRKVADKYE